MSRPSIVVPPFYDAAHQTSLANDDADVPTHRKELFNGVFPSHLGIERLLVGYKVVDLLREIIYLRVNSFAGLVIARQDSRAADSITKLCRR
jgi:hypothetical protein